MNVKKKNQIFIIISMICIIIVVAITYKITNPQVLIPDPEIDEYPVSSSKYLKKQRKILDDIVDNFNNGEIIGKYINNNSTVEANVLGNTIVVNYQNGNIKEQFIFILESDTLSIDVLLDKVDVFNDIFKIMVTANQKRLGNNNDLTDYFSKYPGDDILSNEIIISKGDKDIEYIININKKIDFK